MDEVETYLFSCQCLIAAAGGDQGVDSRNIVPEPQLPNYVYRHVTGA